MKDDIKEQIKQHFKGHEQINFDQNEIIKNADKFVNKFLSNPGIASEKILDLLRAY